MTQSDNDTILDKRYRLLDLLGRGGNGEVYKAFDELHRRQVAVKILSSGSTTNTKNELAKLQREARATAQIVHPNIVSTYAIGATPAGSVYLVMEYADGRSLSATLHDRGPLPLATALDVFVQIATALHVLHQQGVMHRDLTPRNVLLVAREDGLFTAKILDFGMAKVERRSSDAISRTGKAVGTVGYMSPEQCLALGFDKRSEVYAFGLLMYETLVGKSAHPGEGHQRLVHTVHEYPPRLAEVNPAAGIPQSMQNIVFRAISKDPLDRYQNFDEVLFDLQRVALALSENHALPDIDPPNLRKFPLPERKHVSQSFQSAVRSLSQKRMLDRVVFVVAFVLVFATVLWLCAILR